MADFDKALAATLKHEGYYANVKGDRGGETYRGISRKNFPGWPGWVYVDRAKPLRYNQHIVNPALDELIKQFYYAEVWKKIKGDQIQSSAVGGLLFDWLVNSGVWAIRAVQRVTGKPVDGIAGAVTLAAINAADPRQLFNDLKAARVDFVNDIVRRKPSQRKFLDGWLQRIESFEYDEDRTSE